MVAASDGRLSWVEAQSLHEFVSRQGVVSRAVDDSVLDLSSLDRTEELRDVVLDFGRAMLLMATDLHRTN